MTMQQTNPAAPQTVSNMDKPTAEDSYDWFRKISARLLFSRRARAGRVYSRISQLSHERRERSLNEAPLDAKTLNARTISEAEEKGKTVLYLAYGSNLAAETFRGVRKVEPLSQINVVVPQLRLTFDLAGVPYAEPCFANSAVRDPGKDKVPPPGSPSYHKDRWHKGMVGVVYEVTATDYAHIIATEGGGASYDDVLVECYPLEDGASTVPSMPTTAHFMAHTLFAPADPNARLGRCLEVSAKSRLSRPDPSYAQPSLRYLTLIRNGAAEHDLPHEYQDYLYDIRPYTITSTRQTMGKMIFAGIWLPLLSFLFGISKMLQNDRGRAPKWFAAILMIAFKMLWASYDAVFKPAFGDGERTEGDVPDVLDIPGSQ